MGIVIQHGTSIYNRLDSYDQSVLDLASAVVEPLLKESPPGSISHLITSTTCPDKLAPSLGHLLHVRFEKWLKRTQMIDMVQGCAGGISALILGSQLTQVSKSNVIVVLADAARQAVAPDNPLRKVLSNGAYGALLGTNNTEKGLIHFKISHYTELASIVTVNLGHHAHSEIMQHGTTVTQRPLDYLGLQIDRKLAAKMLKRAKSFYDEFFGECQCRPDVIIFHQVNPAIMKILKTVFFHPAIEFVDMSARIGNCGAASFGVALDTCKGELEGKKVFLCSFGTGGVIASTLWQF